MKRWEYMESQTQKQDEIMKIQQNKNLIGRKGASSKPYNILNQEYEASQMGNQFMNVE